MQKRNFFLAIIFSFSLLLCIGAGTLRAQNTSKSISYIEEKGSWYYVYDEKGKRVATLSRNNGTVAGFGTDWFVMTTKNWIYLCDIKGRKYKTMSVSSYGDVVSVGSQTFVTRKGSWLYTFDRNGRKTSTRSAR